MTPLARLAGLFARAPRLDRVAPDRRRTGTPGRASPKTRCIVVRVDEVTFARIARAAKAAGVSPTEAIRQLIARGLNAPDANGES